MSKKVPAKSKKEILIDLDIARSLLVHADSHILAEQTEDARDAIFVANELIEDIFLELRGEWEDEE